MGVEARGGEYDVRRNLMSMNELLRNSIAGDQSGIQLLPGAESAVISRSLLACYRQGCANSTLRKNRQLAARKLRFWF